MAIPIKPDDKNKLVQPKPVQQGSGFTNTQRIAQANQNNRLGQAVGAGVQQAGQQARTAIGAGQQQFQQQAQQSNLDTEANRAAIAQAVQDPTKATDEQVKQFSQYRSGQYAGPQGIQNYDELANQATQAKQLGQSASTVGGRLALLQRFAAKPQQAYTSGQSRLDAALLGQTGSQGIRQARQATLGLQGQLEQGQQAAQAQAQEMQARAQGLKQFTEGQIASQRDPLTKELSDAADAANIQAGKDLASLQEKAKVGGLSTDELKTLGLGDLVGQETYGADIGSNLNLGEKATSQNIASQEQIAKLNALARLGGTEAFGDEAQAGSFAKNKFNIDKDSISKQLAQSKADYETLSSQGQSRVSEARQGMLNSIQKLPDGTRDALAQSFGYTGDPANWTAKNQLIMDKLYGAYSSLSPEQQKMMREDSNYAFAQIPVVRGRHRAMNFNPLSNSELRDAFVGSYGQEQAQQAALQQLRDKYKIGSKFGG